MENTKWKTNRRESGNDDEIRSYFEKTENTSLEINDQAKKISVAITKTSTTVAKKKYLDWQRNKRTLREN